MVKEKGREQGDKGRWWLAHPIKKNGEKYKARKIEKENEAVVNLEAEDQQAMVHISIKYIKKSWGNKWFSRKISMKKTDIKSNRWSKHVNYLGGSREFQRTVLHKKQQLRCL